MTDERIKEALKPCPFCGARAFEPEKISSTGRPLWRTGCTLYCVSMSRAGKKLLTHDWNTRAAERLAKIEALENVRREMFNENNDYEDMMSHMDRMIAELKEEGE